MIGGGVVLLGLGAWQCTRCGGDDPDDAGLPRPVSAADARLPDAPGGYQAYLIDTLGDPARGDKLKDALGGNGPKVNVYAEDGIWGRAKVDLDRDEKWDEKWTFKPGGVVEKQVARADDENYTETLRFIGGAWSDAAAPLPAPPSPSPDPDADPVPPEPAPTTAVDLDPDTLPIAPEPRPNPARDLAAGGVVEQAMALALGRPVTAKIKDTTKGRPYKINIYSDDGTAFNRAKVDLDRDDKWDEKWTFKPDGSIEKQVSPADDDATYPDTYVFEAGRWRKI
jgi:hypothetical protein